MSDFGMKFVSEGQDMSQRNGDRSDGYSTDNNIVQVDFTRDPKHLDLISPLSKASVFTLTVANGTDEKYAEEVLFQIEHGLPFVPDHLCYFYTTDSPYPLEIGSYQLDLFRIGTAGEYLQAICDERYFKIIHSASVKGAGGFSTTYPYTYTVNGANQRSFKIKYMILQRPSSGYATYNPT